MKRSLFCLLLLLCLLLTGCTCEHEWTQADCTSAQICTKCQETGDPALGHHWLPADCTAAETCSRCGLTQGAPADHIYGPWSFTEAEMIRSCQTCGVTETAELDRELYLEHLLLGHWDCYGIFQGDSFYSPYMLSGPGDTLLFGAERTVTGTVNMAEVSCSWEFDTYMREDEEDHYYFFLLKENGKKLPMLLSCTQEADYLYIFYNSTDQVLLTRNDALVSSLCGTWGAEGGGGMCSLTLREDRTVSGDLDGPLEGTWQPLPLEYSEMMGSHAGIFISFERSGETVHLLAIVYPEDRYREMTSEEFLPESLFMNNNGARLSFTAMTQEELESKRTAMQEGPNMLVGTWYSMYWRSFAVNPNQDTLALDYSITFLSDGTFTANVGKELSGTWKFDDSLDFQTQTIYTYYLYIDGEKFPCDMELNCTENHVPELHILNHSTVPGDGRTLYLNRRDSGTDAFMRTLIGDWTSVSEEVYIHGQDASTSYILDYSFTFLEDGSFTGYDGQERKGTWVYVQTRDETVSQYDLFLDGQPGTPYASITMYDRSSSGIKPLVHYTVTSQDNITRTISLAAYSQEEAEMSRQGPTYILGEWVSESGGHSIVIHEDGTFTANLDTTIQGSWSFREYNPDSGFWYNFTFPEQRQYCDKTLYAFPNEGRITFRIATDQGETFYQMRRG